MLQLPLRQADHKGTVEGSPLLGWPVLGSREG